MKQTITVLLVLTILLGQISMSPRTLTPLGKTYNSRFGWTMPAYFDGLAATFDPAYHCRDLQFFTGWGETYDNNFAVAFFRDGQLIETRSLVFQPWEIYFFTTSFTYDQVVILNTDNKQDSAYAIYCWMRY